jgi:S-adenosylmethionine decarboxylase
VSQADSCLGWHLLADLHGVPADRLRDGAALESLLRRAAVQAGARVLASRFHAFGPGCGITGLVLLAESHISIHTWPECGVAAADIFMCGTADPNVALAVLLGELCPAGRHITSVARGRMQQTDVRHVT